MHTKIAPMAVTLTLSQREFQTLQTALSIYGSRTRSILPHITDTNDKAYYVVEATNAQAMLESTNRPEYT